MTSAIVQKSHGFESSLLFQVLDGLRVGMSTKDKETVLSLGDSAERFLESQSKGKDSIVDGKTGVSSWGVEESTDPDAWKGMNERR